MGKFTQRITRRPVVTLVESLPVLESLGDTLPNHFMFYPNLCPANLITVLTLRRNRRIDNCFMHFNLNFNFFWTLILEFCIQILSSVGIKDCSSLDYSREGDPDEIDALFVEIPTYFSCTSIVFTGLYLSSRTVFQIISRCNSRPIWYVVLFPPSEIERLFLPIFPDDWHHRMCQSLILHFSQV